MKNEKRKEHIIATGQINILGLILGDKLPKNFLFELKKLIGFEMSKLELMKFLTQFKLSDYAKKVIFRISENRGFLREFHGFGLYKRPNYANTSSGKEEKEKEIFRWTLYS